MTREGESTKFTDVFNVKIEELTLGEKGPSVVSLNWFPEG